MYRHVRRYQGRTRSSQQGAHICVQRSVEGPGGEPDKLCIPSDYAKSHSREHAALDQLNEASAGKCVTHSQRAYECRGYIQKIITHQALMKLWFYAAPHFYWVTFMCAWSSHSIQARASLEYSLKLEIEERQEAVSCLRAQVCTRYLDTRRHLKCLLTQSWASINTGQIKSPGFTLIAMHVFHSSRLFHADGSCGQGCVSCGKRPCSTI